MHFCRKVSDANAPGHRAARGGERFALRIAFRQLTRDVSPIAALAEVPAVGASNHT
jgi:hypothetical protein